MKIMLKLLFVERFDMIVKVPLWCRYFQGSPSKIFIGLITQLGKRHSRRSNERRLWLSIAVYSEIFLPETASK